MTNTTSWRDGGADELGVGWRSRELHGSMVVCCFQGYTRLAVRILHLFGVHTRVYDLLYCQSALINIILHVYPKTKMVVSVIPLEL